MTWNPEAIYRKQLAWLIRMARKPGWKAQAWHRAQELDADTSGLFKGIAADLVKRMRGRKSAPGAQESGDLHEPNRPSALPTLRAIPEPQARQALERHGKAERAAAHGRKLAHQGCT